MKIRFLIYGALGWIIEIIWTGFSSLLNGDWSLKGFSSLWMFPIYGMGVLLEPIHDRIRHLNWFVRGIIWMLIIFALEYATGWLVKALTGHYVWYYSSPLAIRGLIRLDYAPAWFALGLFFEKLHDYLTERVKI